MKRKSRRVSRPRSQFLRASLLTSLLLVVATAAELGVAVAGYSCGHFLDTDDSILTFDRFHSPLGHGFLTGQIQSIDDLSRQSLRTDVPLIHRS